MRVLFVNLPWRGRDYAVRAGSRWAHSLKNTKRVVNYRPFPFFMASAAALIEKKHEVLVIDALAEELGESEFFRKIKEFRPEVTVAEISTPSYNNDISFLKEIKKLTNSKIIVAGQHPSALPEEVIKENSFISNVLVGEYEYILQSLLANRKPLTNQAQNQIKNVKSKILRNTKLPDIDTIPWPARHLFDMKLYNEPFCDSYPNIQMMASRGCYYRCSYCNTFLLYGGRNYRFRNPKDIVDEMEYCVGKYLPKEFYFDDDLINAEPEKLEEMCLLKIKRKIGTPFSAMAHSNISRKILEIMKKAGCRALKFGVETADEEVLRQLGKGITIEMVKKAVQNCKELGIRTHLTYAIGLPGETKESIRKTIRFALKYGDSYQISLATPYPGTPLYNLAKSKGWLQVDSWEDYDGAKKSIMDLPNLSAGEIYELYLLGQKSFYRKLLESGEYKKFIRMAYQEGGLPNLAKLFFIRGPGLARSIIESKLKLR
jgi:anaerobic magnesium-protoporphyrin IX monomethyl ester cyclase